MPVTTVWDNVPKTVIRVEFAGKWVWDDYYQAHLEFLRLLATVPHNVNVIADLLHSDVMLPEGSLSRARAIFATSPRNRGFMVVVGANVLVKMFFPLFRRVYGMNTGLPEIYFAETLQEAREQASGQPTS